MKRVWAPWRSEYVGGKKKSGCVFCRILSEQDDRGNLVLKRGAGSAIVMNRYPYTAGHLMICPNRHVAGIRNLNRDERLELMDLTAEAIDALEQTMKPEGFNTGLNLGKAAGAGIQAHLHFHVVPRWNGDNNFMPVTADTRVISQDLDKIWEQLKPRFNQQVR